MTLFKRIALLATFTIVATLASTAIAQNKSPLAKLELQDGDVILEIGGREPNSTQHAMRILMSFEPGERLGLTIMRNQQRQTLEIRLPDSAERG